MVVGFMNRGFSLKRALFGSIRKKVFIYFFILIAGSILLLSGIFYSISINSLNDQVRSHLEAIAQSRTTNIDLYLDSHAQRVNLIASRTQLRKDIRDYLQNPNEIRRQEIILNLNDSSKSVDEIDLVCVLDLTGKVVACNKAGLMEANFINDSFFIFGKIRARAYFFNLNGEEDLIFSAPIMQDGNLIGVMITTEVTDNLKKIIYERTGMGETEEVTVGFKDKEGNIIYPFPRLFEEQSVNVDFTEKTAEPMKRALNGEVTFLSSSLDYRNVKVIAAINYLSVYQLGVVSKIDYAEAIGEVQWEFLITAGYLFILVLLVFSLLSYWFSNRLIRPILDLANITEKMTHGDFSARVRIRSGDELERLGESFNKMIKDLQEAQESLESKVRERTKELYTTQNSLERRTIQADQAKVATLNILEDVEESKEKLDEAYKQLRSLEKLKNEFLSFTSHELKTPLTPILIQAQMLQEGDLGRLSSEQKKSIDMIVRNMRTLNQLIGDVLDISVIQSANLKIFPLRTDVAEIIRQMVANATPLADKKNIKITMKISRLHHLLIDSRRIGQVVTNLLSNAIKFTPENGAVSVEAAEDENYITVKVMDTGIGIDKDKIKTLFQPFSQVVASYTLKQKGTGLGLAICKGIIEAHKGKIGVQSEIGKGATFYFKLPRKWHFTGNKN